MPKTSKTVAPVVAVPPSVKNLSGVVTYSKSTEWLPIASVMTEAVNYSRPDFKREQVKDSDLYRKIESNGQANPCLILDTSKGSVLVAGFRRAAVIAMLHAEGKGDGQIMVRRVMTDKDANLSPEAVAALVNLNENEDGREATGVKGRLAVYSTLAKASLSPARIAALTGQKAVDYVADTLRFLHPETDPRMRLAVEAYEDRKEVFEFTETVKGKDGTDKERKGAGMSAPFGLVRLIVRAPEFIRDADDKSDRYSQWEAFREVGGMPISKATTRLNELKEGKAKEAARRVEAEAKRKAAAEAKAAKAAQNGNGGEGPERGAGDNEESTKSADKVRELGAHLMIPFLLDLRKALAEENIATAQDLLARATGKDGCASKAFGWNNVQPLWK